MLKRLIEVALPLKEVSEQSAREKSIRHGHISTLHIWWARRPLAACRAVVFASLIPDPDDPECPDSFRKSVRKELGADQFKPTGIGGETIEDTPRNRCMEFIKELVKYENSNNPHYTEPARRLIRAGHAVFDPESADEAPKVLDPFAGGGAIPLEALRLGCEAHAVDINPVAHLIELCTLIYPQKYGRPLPPTAPVPDHILEAVKKSQDGTGHLFGHSTREAEAVYRKNPLAADVKYWGYWVLERARTELAEFYPPDADGAVAVAYLWARTVKCVNPSCGATIPLIRQLWLCKKSGRNIALRIVPNATSKVCEFEVVAGKRITFDPENGTMQRGQGACPFCETVANSKYLQAEGRAGRIGQQLLAVVTVKKGETGKRYRPGTPSDMKVYARATHELSSAKQRFGNDITPGEPLIVWSGVFNAPLFGMIKWSDLFNARQLLALTTFVRHVRAAIVEIQKYHAPEYAKAVGTLLATGVSRLADFNSSLCVFNNVGGRGVVHTFGRQALPMIWDYAETAPFNPQGANWQASIDAAAGVITHTSFPADGRVVRGSATALPLEGATINAVLTDPPYYDAVPYSDLSDFFYVWEKRTVGDLHPDIFRTPLTPKAQEVVSHLGKNYPGKRKTAADYESGMAQVFAEMHRVLKPGGIAAVMFAHKTTSAWEAIITGLIKSGLLVTSSWPFHTERPGRLRAHDSAALASSVTLICRKRAACANEGLWDDVRRELREVAAERLDFFWNQGIRGADFFISAVGPALSVFGRYARVKRMTGEEVTVGQFLDDVRTVVTHYAMSKIMKNVRAGAVDTETQFYVMWRWSYADAPVPADEAFKLAQALGLETDVMWDRTGILTKSGENVQATPIAQRMKIDNLGEPAGDGRPASVVDVLHHLCALREKGDSIVMGEFLSRSGQTNNQSLWTVAQAMSEILPDGDKEKQLLQGLLNQRDGLMEAARQGTLFKGNA